MSFSKEKRLTMNKLNFSTAVAAIILTACSQTPTIPSQWRFDYASEHRVEGVIRAFDDGERAVVQFVDLAHAQPRFTDQAGAPIEYEIRGQYAVLPDIPATFMVQTVDGKATFHYMGAVAVPHQGLTEERE